MTDEPINWPVIYLDLDLDEELMVVNHEDWYHDVDTHWTIGPITGNNHFFIDTQLIVRQLHGVATKPFDFPQIKIGPQAQREDVLRILYERAKKWHDINTRDINAIISAAKN